MARRKKGVDAEVKKKKVNLVPAERMVGGKITTIYRLLEKHVEESFRELADARLKVCWDMAPPRELGDGQLRIFRVKKGSDIDQQMAEFDFVFIVSHEIWNKKLGEADLEPVTHKMLCHCDVQRTKDGEIREDENDRPVFRNRKPPIQTFPENVRKYGPWETQIVKLSETLADFNDRNRPLLKASDKKPAARFSEPAMGATNGAATNGANGHAANGHANGNGNGKEKAAKKKAAAK